MSPQDEQAPSDAPQPSAAEQLGQASAAAKAWSEAFGAMLVPHARRALGAGRFMLSAGAVPQYLALFLSLTLVLWICLLSLNWGPKLWYILVAAVLHGYAAVHLARSRHSAVDETRAIAAKAFADTSAVSERLIAIARRQQSQDGKHGWPAFLGALYQAIRGIRENLDRFTGRSVLGGTVRALAVAGVMLLAAVVLGIVVWSLGHAAGVALVPFILVNLALLVPPSVVVIGAFTVNKAALFIGIAEALLDSIPEAQPGITSGAEGQSARG